jgi:hypothetical protein
MKTVLDFRTKIKVFMLSTRLLTFIHLCDYWQAKLSVFPTRTPSTLLSCFYLKFTSKMAPGRGFQHQFTGKNVPNIHNLGYFYISVKRIYTSGLRGILNESVSLSEC